MIIKKRNGSEEDFSFAKWHAYIRRMCDGIEGVSASQLETELIPHLENGMSTEDLDVATHKVLVSLIDELERPDVGNTNYQFVGGRHAMTMLYKKVYGRVEVPRLYSLVKKGVDCGLYTPELLRWYSEAEWDRIEQIVDHSKDFKLPLIAVEYFIDKYLVQDRTTKTHIETPQVRYIVAAATAANPGEGSGLSDDTFNRIAAIYEESSNGSFTLPTPVCAGLGTRIKQFSSCVKVRIGDNMKSIFKGGEIIASYAAWRAGIGLDTGSIRAEGSAVKNGAVKHTGHIPFLKKLYHDLTCVNQGGVRKASATANYPLWHKDFQSLIVLKNNQGIDENRVRHLDYAFAVNKFLLSKVYANETIYFFDPHDVPDLYNAFYSDSTLFEKLYTSYSKNTRIKKTKLKAEEVFKGMLLKERSDTNRIYIVLIDNVQNQGPFNTVLTPITQTNLCVEVLLPTEIIGKIENKTFTLTAEELPAFLSNIPDDIERITGCEATASGGFEIKADVDVGRVALCTLGSINLGKFDKATEMERPVRTLVRMLHDILGYQDYVSFHSRKHTEEFEPLGVGITNLAYFLAKRGMRYGDADALAAVKEFMEHINFYAICESVQIAKEKQLAMGPGAAKWSGACKKFHTTWWAKGVFPWERRAKAVDELCDFTPSANLDWEWLRSEILQWGMANATLTAIAPVESSSVILGTTNGLEPVKDLVIAKDTNAGAVPFVVPDFHRLRNSYDKTWDTPDLCERYLKTCAVAGVYVCQGMSVNTWASAAHFDGKKVSATYTMNLLLTAAKYGLKSLYYHNTDKSASGATGAQSTKNAPETPPDDTVCDSCAI